MVSSEPRGQGWWLRVLVVALLAWGALYVQRTSFVHEGTRVFSLWDDGMISMQYARNLREGHGLVWNPGGERVQGISNLGPTLLMAALHWLPLDPTRAALPFQLLNLALLAALPLLAFRVARSAFPDAPAVAIGTAIGTALCAPLAVWTLQGSDVGVIALWLLAALALLARGLPDGGSERRFAALLGAGLLIRPDAPLFYVPLLIGAAALPGPAGAVRRRLALGGGVLLLVEGALLGFSALYYGDPLPNTYYLKATGAPRADMIRSALGQLGASVRWGVVPLALAAVGVAVGWRRPIVPLCAALLGAALLYSLWVGGDWSFGYGMRYTAPCLPLLLLLALGGWWTLLGRVLPRAARERSAGAALSLATGLTLVALASPAQSHREWLDPRGEPMHRDYNASNYRYAHYLRENTAPDTTLAVHWAGIPPYFSRRPAVDVLGKSDRHIARLPVTEFVPGHGKWDWDYVLGVRQPDVFRGPSRGLELRPDFREGYFRVETGQTLQFYLRKTSLAKLTGGPVVLVDQATGERRQHPLRTRRRGPGR